MKCIVAVDRNWAIGKDGGLLCRLSPDLRRFREMTTGHPIVMGRKTLESFPKGPLPGRRNIVLSRDPSYTVEGAEVVHDPLLAADIAGEEGFLIGGESIYRLLLPRCSTVYVTKIDAAFPADAWFPDLDADPTWEVSEEEPPLEHDGIPFRYVTYRRREN